MTGYTVHTGSTVAFSDSWDRIFSGDKPPKKKKAAKKSTKKKPTKKSATKKKAKRSPAKGKKKIAKRRR